MVLGRHLNVQPQQGRQEEAHPPAPRKPPQVLRNVPKGKILQSFFQPDKTSWRVQIAPVETRSKGDEIRFNIRHWDAKGYPMGGTENGFPLLPREAQTLIEALQEGLRMIEAGEITPGDSDQGAEQSPERPVDDHGGGTSSRPRRAR